MYMSRVIVDSRMAVNHEKFPMQHTCYCPQLATLETRKGLGLTSNLIENHQIDLNGFSYERIIIDKLIRAFADQTFESNCVF